MKISSASTRAIEPVMVRNIDFSNSRIMTDGHRAYRLLRKHGQHDTINHELEYVRGDVHTQGIENYWSLLKRGITGVFHHVGEQHLDGYLAEFEFRFNRRKISDAERFASLMGQTSGRVLWFCRTPQPENPHG